MLESRESKREEKLPVGVRLGVGGRTAGAGGLGGVSMLTVTTPCLARSCIPCVSGGEVGGELLMTARLVRRLAGRDGITASLFAAG